MVEILISSGLGEEDYGLGKPDKRYDQTRYEELASVMNQRGFSNRAGQPLNRNALKQVVHRVRQKEDLMDELKPDWEKFRDSGYTPDTQGGFSFNNKKDKSMTRIQRIKRFLEDYKSLDPYLKDLCSWSCSYYQKELIKEDLKVSRHPYPNEYLETPK
jgi:hypothetical protein